MWCVPCLTGLVKAVGRDDDMLAFVLAHEMGKAESAPHLLMSVVFVFPAYYFVTMQ